MYSHYNDDWVDTGGFLRSVFLLVVVVHETVLTQMLKPIMISYMKYSLGIFRFQKIQDIFVEWKNFLRYCSLFVKGCMLNEGYSGKSQADHSSCGSS